jgi:ADP-heptose:LPS heptosyltransferase
MDPERGSRLIDFGDAVDTTNGPFMDTAAIMKNLDLVISSDTSVPHLAGALGVPVWVALPHVPNWRWLLDRPDSPWYPTMRLFRQQEAGNWAGVLEEIQTALQMRLAGDEGLEYSAG